MKQHEMDKKIYLLNIHSFIDVITNSSTELFVGKSNKDVETIKEICIDLINTYNKIHDTNYSFDKVFEEPYVITELNIDEFINTIQGFDPNILTEFDILEKLKLTYKYPYNNYKEYNDKIKDIVDKEYQKYVNNELSNIKKQYLGNIVLCGKSDNSIPSSMFDYLDDLFDSYNFNSRIHLG